ncbi:MAG: hypothetical protein H7A33_00065 [Deltaproteobacteria bacterium]|nr:hypothetical protein [Deltaproteobacteria bacterium]
MTEVLKELGSKRAVVVHADNGMDEFSLSCVNHVGQLQENGEMIYSVFDPRETGYAFCDESELLGKDPKNNALRLKECLKGHSQALDHTVHINAAWGLLAAGQASEFMDALLIAQQSVSSGKAFHCLERLVDLTNSG